MVDNDDEMMMKAVLPHKWGDSTGVIHKPSPSCLKKNYRPVFIHVLDILETAYFGLRYNMSDELLIIVIHVLTLAEFILDCFNHRTLLLGEVLTARIVACEHKYIC